MVSPSVRLLHYKRKEIQEALCFYAEDKEIGVRYGGGGYGKRPDTIVYPQDVMAFVTKGVTSFHCSEELWINPLQIQSGMKRHELDSLRKGWDLILDIDCDKWEYSQIAADLVVQFLQHQGIKNVSVKFSGNHGFHIGVCAESFPEVVNGEELRKLFPEGPRKIAAYIAHMIKPHLARKFLEVSGTAEACAAAVGKTIAEVTPGGVFDPYQVLVIDTVLISSRHLYRMPYSLNEKSGLVSVPIAANSCLQFDRATAVPSKVNVNEHVFLDRSKVVSGEGGKLLMQSLDFVDPTVPKKINYAEQAPTIDFALPEGLFPPCVKALLGDLPDGKKRAMFVLVNFLKCVGWSPEEIEERMKKWNEGQSEPIRETILVGHLRHHLGKKGRVLPPNCDNIAYYEGLRVCAPDHICNRKGPKMIKNPAAYGMSRARRLEWERKMNNKKENNKDKKTKKEQNPPSREVSSQPVSSGEEPQAL